MKAFFRRLRCLVLGHCWVYWTRANLSGSIPERRGAVCKVCGARRGDFDL